MASVFESAWKAAVQAEKELLKALAEKEPTFAEMNNYLKEFRIACQDAIFQDFDSARSVDVEGRLWDATVRINSRFRKLLARFRDNSGKKRPVEKRKLEKHYLDFIKTSQRFYRGYIQELASHFGGMQELEKVARRFKYNPPSDAQVELTPDLRKRILASCHATLIRLGDLSRYRETELAHKDRNWGPATGYYDLASTINPSSGTSHNQLAIIALVDNNHLRATYHLYRALCALEPHPTSRKNLEIEFRKVLNKKNIIPSEDAGIPGRALIPWFVYLHAECYKGVDFAEHDELENEVMSQLTVGLKERPLEAILQKFALINIAAEDVSKIRLKGECQLYHDPSSNARHFFQRINVKTFFTLLQILLPELERFTTDDCESSKQDSVTVVARRVLPAIRQYSSWLLSNYGALVVENMDQDTALHIQIREFWKLYASTLSLLASTFDIGSLPEIHYLLEEDEETFGFMPLMNDETGRRFFVTNRQKKPQMQDDSVERNHPNDEMLFRIRDFFIDGLYLVVNKKIPITLVDDNGRNLFVYQEEGLPSQLFASPNGHHHSLSSTSVERDDIQQARETRNYAENAGPAADDAASQSASASVSANTSMHRMVDALVDSEISDIPPPVAPLPVIQDGYPLTPTGHPLEPESNYIDKPPNAETGLSSNYSTIRPSQTPTLAQFPAGVPYSPRPNLPSIFNSAFAPQPGEAPSPNSRPGTARQTSPQVGSPRPTLADIGNFPTPQGPMSSYTEVQQNLYARKQALSSSPQDFSSSWDTPVPLSREIPINGVPQINHLNRLPHLQQYPPNRAFGDKYTTNPFPGSSPFSNPGSFMGDSPRPVNANLGAIGQTPPSGQGGG
ncbi:hypothetical protein FQN54_007529 [Arachnomyces sp. PD_36]|nr:hypothetical protein FQN54_007529 [Arachnomyces sp. PD_36]